MTLQVGDLVTLTRDTSEHHKKGMIARITVLLNEYIGWTVPDCPCGHSSVDLSCNGVSYDNFHYHIQPLGDGGAGDRFKYLLLE